MDWMPWSKKSWLFSILLRCSLLTKSTEDGRWATPLARCMSQFTMPEHPFVNYEKHFCHVLKSWTHMTAACVFDKHLTLSILSQSYDKPVIGWLLVNRSHTRLMHLYLGNIWSLWHLTHIRLIIGHISLNRICELTLIWQKKITRAKCLVASVWLVVWNWWLKGVTRIASWFHQQQQIHMVFHELLLISNLL